MAGRQTLEAVVNCFRREAAANNPGRHLELEVRVQDVDAATLAAILGALARRESDSRPIRAGPPTLSHTVSVLMPAPAGVGAPGAPMAGAQRATIVREMSYVGGRKVADGYKRKEPLLIPWHSPRDGGLAYSVALAAEAPERRGPIADESALIRVKARASFPLEVQASSEDGAAPTRWRVDLSAVRVFGGTEVETVKSAVDAMFRGAGGAPATPADLLGALGVVAPASGVVDAAVAALYRFEVEIEYDGAPGERDALRAADVTAAAELVIGLASPARAREVALQAAICRAAKYLLRGGSGAALAADMRRFETGAAGLRQLLPQVRALSRASYREIFPPRGYYLTDKADGQRALAMCAGARGLIAADELFEFANSASAEAEAANSETILDGELLRGPDGALAFYAFDAIAVNGADLTADDFGARLARLAEGVAALAAAGVPAFAKPYSHIAAGAAADIERAVRGVHEAARPYPVDGLIFVAPGLGFAETPAYKWKSTRDNTIDFLARRAPKAARARSADPSSELYYLFVGVSPQMFAALGLQRCPGYAELFPNAQQSYFPVQFSPCDAPLAYLFEYSAGAEAGALDGRIVEMRLRTDDSGGRAAGAPAARASWELVRVREDRGRDLARGGYFGNDYRTAELTWLNYIDVFELADLWVGPAGGYFQAAGAWSQGDAPAHSRAGVYGAQTATLNFAKGRLIEAAAARAAWVVDVGAGRGSDLGRYLAAEVAQLMAVDSDRAALAELVRRRYEHARRRPAGGRAAAGLTVRVLAADVGGPAAALRARFGALGLPAEGADALVCNLAAHYFMGSAEALKNFAALAAATVRPGGALALTVLDGAAVFAALASTGPGETWDRLEEPAGAPAGAPVLAARKYSLKRLYASDALEAAGQRIGVLLPFSDGQYYEEYLVNIEALSRQLALRGFGAPKRESVSEAAAAFAVHNRPLAAELTAADREWLGLFTTLLYRRKA